MSVLYDICKYDHAIILEAARLGMAMVGQEICDEMDISDEEFVRVRDLLEKAMNDEDAGRKTIAILWSVEDVEMRAKERDIELTREQALDILARLDHNHDATIGICWDTIDIVTDLYLDDF